MHVTRSALAACTAAALAAAGCGGGALSKKDLASKANAICAKYSKEGDELKAPQDIGDAKQAQAFFDKAHDIAKRQQDELEDLEPADDVKAGYTAMTKATGKATTLLGDLAQAAEDADQAKGASLLRQLQPDSRAVDRTARAIGATRCAS